MRACSWRRTITRTVGVSGLVAAFLELLARALTPAPLEWKQDARRLLQYDAERGWSLRSGAVDYTVDKLVTVNASGFRDRDFSEGRTPGVRRIACVGDSYTFGLGVELDETFPKQLEKRLNEEHPTEVLNFGVCGQDGRQARLNLEKVALRYHPDLVIYSMYWDDLVPTPPEKLTRERVEARIASEVSRHSWLRDGLRCSRALYFLVNRVGALGAAIAPRPGRFHDVHQALLAGRDDAIRDAWDDLAREVVAMRDASRARGARFAVVAWPVPEQVLGETTQCRFLETARALGDRLGVPVVSTLEPLVSLVHEGTSPYLPYETHPTAEGYARSASAIACALAADVAALDGPGQAVPASQR
jgi:hypothetical protein